MAGEVGLARNGMAIVPVGNCDTNVDGGAVETILDGAGVVQAVDARTSRPSIQVRKDNLIKMFSYSRTQFPWEEWIGPLWQGLM